MTKNRFRVLFIFISLLLLSSRSESVVIFQHDVETATSCGDIFSVNCYGGATCSISTTQSNSGTHSIRLSYPSDEAGCELKPAVFAATTSLYTRKYEYYDANWATNWPVGLKTSRYFTTTDWSLGPGSANAYMSEKLIWQGYDGNPNDLYARGMNNAINNLDLVARYNASSLGYIRAGQWYKLETWMVLNSAVDATNGVLRIWINDILVYSNNKVVWKSSSRGCPNGTAWRSMWFGGNYSGATFGNPTTTLYRYIDDVYVSNTLDRTPPPFPPTSAPSLTAR